MFDEIKWLCVFAKYTSLKFVTESQSSYVSKLIMSPFSPFSVECKKLIAKNHWKCILGHLRELRFHISPMSINWYWLHLVHLVLNAKNLLQKTFGNVLLGHLGELRFHISPLDHRRWPPPHLLEFLWIMLQYSIQPLCKI